MWKLRHPKLTVLIRIFSRVLVENTDSKVPSSFLGQDLRRICNRCARRLLQSGHFGKHLGKCFLVKIYLFGVNINICVFIEKYYLFQIFRYQTYHLIFFMICLHPSVLLLSLLTFDTFINCSMLKLLEILILCSVLFIIVMFSSVYQIHLMVLQRFIFL